MEQAGQELTAGFAIERAALLKELEQSKHNMQEAQQAYTKEMESQKQHTASLLDTCPTAAQYNQVMPVKQYMMHSWTWPRCVSFTTWVWQLASIKSVHQTEALAGKPCTVQHSPACTC